MKSLDLSLLLLFTLLVSDSFCQSWNWAEEASLYAYGRGEGFTLAMAADNYGNSFITGMFQDTLSFNSTMLVNGANNWTSFLTKYDVNGKILWTRQAKTPYSKSTTYGGAYAVATDASGNAYVTGYFQNPTITFGSRVLSAVGDESAFLVKYDANGNVLWANEPVSSSAFSLSAGVALASGPSGNIYTVAYFLDTIKLGTTTLTSHYGDYYVAKYSPGGTALWAKAPIVHSAGCLYTITSLAVDRSDNVFVTGHFQDTIRFGSIKLVSNGGNSAFIMKYDMNGNVLWAVQASAPTNSACSSECITTDNMGGIYLAGSYNDTLSFDSRTVCANPGHCGDIYIAKYDNSGKAIWAITSCSKSKYPWLPYGIITDNSGHILLSAGESFGEDSIRFGSTWFSNGQIGDNNGSTLIAKFDTTGNIWCGTAFNGGGVNPNPICTTPSGEYVFLSGSAWGKVGFGSDTLPDQGYCVPFNSMWGGCAVPNAIENTPVIEDEVKVYPNPGTGLYTISMQGFSTPGLIEIYNILGEKINVEEINSPDTKIDLSAKPNGIYMYRVLSINGDLIANGKLIKA